ncbi:MAG: hypothetical protein HOQ24_03090 [Mycobacteriaceae bacterium]|nr:hypothetical protein [Mycobacteriaceae bacterium]
MDALAPDFRVAADQLLSADGFHPSGAGYALAATALLPALSDALDRPERPVTCA